MSANPLAPAWLDEPADANALPAQVWSLNAARGASGELTIGGVAASALVAEYGTPVYVVDELDVLTRATRIRESFDAEFSRVGSAAHVYYAGKAFLCTEVARWVTGAGLRIDVASGGELAVALAAGVDPSLLGLHGNNKSLAEIDRAVSVGVGAIVIDSLVEVDRVADAAARHNRVQSVRLRINSGVHASTHEYLATAREDQKFGIPIVDAPAVVAAIRARPELAFLGLHSHIGSQIFESDGFAEAARRLFALHAELLKGGPVPELNLGGGFGIAYTSVDDPLSIEQIARTFADIVAAGAAEQGVPVPILAIEPGRAVIGPSTTTLYTVGTIKDVLVSLPEALEGSSLDAVASSPSKPRDRLSDRHPQVRLRRRRHERQHPPVALQGRLLGAHREPRVRSAARARAHCRQALRVRRHRRARRLPARRRATRRHRRRAGHRRVRLGDGQQLQLPRAPARGRSARRPRPRDRARRDRRRPAGQGHRSEPMIEYRNLRVAILGGGSVGAQVASLLLEHGDELAQRAGAGLELVGVAVRDPSASRSADIPAHLLTTDVESLILGSDIVVELIGGVEPARTFILQALASGADVITGNKAVLANHGPELFELAEQVGAQLYYEAAVGGAIPIIRPLRDSLAGDRVRRILGIVNGTTNYILDRMDVARDTFAEALAEATRLGYAEADPTADVEGYDAAQKAAILASLAFHTTVPLESVHREGMTTVTAEQVEQARSAGFVVKLLAICERITTPDGTEGVSARVHPALVPLDHPLAAVHGANNAVFVEAEAAGSLMFYGAGAGGVETASAVLGDLVSAARRHVAGGPGVAESTNSALPVLPMSSVITRYQVTLAVVDAPGVLATVAGVFAEHGVSVETVAQAVRGGGDQPTATLVIVTHEASESSLASTVAALAANPVVSSVVSTLRVEGLQ